MASIASIQAGSSEPASAFERSHVQSLPDPAVGPSIVSFDDSPKYLTGNVAQGRRDSNPQPPVLETGALPIELLP